MKNELMRTHVGIHKQPKTVNALGVTWLKAVCILALAACSWAQPSITTAGHPVSRPVKIIEGHMTIVINPVTGDYEFTDWAWATHTGLATNAGTGVLDPFTGQFLSGSGVVVTANADEIWWEVGPAPNTVVYTGGTGRFEGVTGGFAATITSQTLIGATDEGLPIFAITYEGSGIITY